MAEAFFDARTLYEDDELSIAMVILKGVGRQVRNTGSALWYQVLSGEGMFEIELANGKSHTEHVGLGSLVMVPRGSVYHDEGDLMMLVTARPPFDERSVLTID